MNAPSVLSDDRPHGVESETRSLPNPLRREKGIEDVVLYLRRNSRTVIADFDDGIAIFAENVEPEFSPTDHRFDGALDKIGPDLLSIALRKADKSIAAAMRVIAARAVSASRSLNKEIRVSAGIPPPAAALRIEER